MNRLILEKYQIFIYIGAILTGMLFGLALPEPASLLDAALWPVLGLLLYTTFTQVPLTNIHKLVGDYRFLSAAVVGNFLIIPVIVWGLVMILPDNPALRVGVALVLLVPCTDWFITFTQLGGGDTQRAIAFSPFSLLLQMVFLPFWMFLIFGGELTVSLATNHLFTVFAGIILLPLILAYLTQNLAGKEGPIPSKFVHFTGRLPVPLLATVILLIAASQAHIITDATPILWYPAITFTGYLAIAAALAWLISRTIRLPIGQSRVLVFSFGSRNSFVVLPIALALPDAYAPAVIVIVLQSLIELFGMAVYVWMVPGRLFPNSSG